MGFLQRHRDQCIPVNVSMYTLLKLRMWKYSESVIPAFRVDILEHSLTLFLLKIFSNSELGITGATFDRIILWAGVNIGLSILLLTVIVLCRFVRCSTVSFLSRYAKFDCLRFWRCTLLIWVRLVSLSQRHSLGGLCHLLRG